MNNDATRARPDYLRPPLTPNRNPDETSGGMWLAALVIDRFAASFRMEDALTTMPMVPSCSLFRARGAVCARAARAHRDLLSPLLLMQMNYRGEFVLRGGQGASRYP